jgi:hypothetical protein
LENTTYQFWDIVIQSVVALGTIAVAILAIFGNTIRKYFYRPKLQIETSTDSPFVSTVYEQNENTSEQNTYTRICLKISNEGKSALDSCQGLIEVIYEKRKANDSFCLFKKMMPTQFEWDASGSKKIIVPKIPGYLEVAKIQKDYTLSSNPNSAKNTKITEPNSELFISINAPNQNKGIQLKLGQGTFILPVIIYADNLSRPAKYFVEIYWMGKDHKKYEASDFYVKLLSEKELPEELKNEL